MHSLPAKTAAWIAIVITPSACRVKQASEYDSNVVTEAVKALSAEEIAELCVRHTLYDWGAQTDLKPLPVVSAKGIYFHTADGRRFMDFNSQLMCVNAGHGDRRIIEAIQRQAEQPPYLSPLLADLEETIQLEGPSTIAAFLLEPISGTNGILVPPDGYLQGVRALCDRYGILMICDEVMTGFGRTGRWFAVEHWGVLPDLITLAKGLTSSYVPLDQVAMRPHVAAYFDDHAFYGGLTYNSHPLACAAALGAIQAYEEDDMVGNSRRMGEVLARHHRKLRERHPCVGATRSIGLFGCLELVRDRQTLEPLAPFNGTSPEMKAVTSALLEGGMHTFVRWNTIMTNPPLCITEEQLDEGFEILDSALEIGDRAVRD